MSAHVGTTVAAHDCTTVTAHDGVAALGRVPDGRTRTVWSYTKWARAERSRGGCRVVVAVHRVCILYGLISHELEHLRIISPKISKILENALIRSRMISCG